MASSGSSYIRRKITPANVLQKLKHYCSYCERSRSDIKQKLYSLGLYKKEAEELISRLINEEYLDEERFARQFASGKCRIKGWGKLKIRFELRQKGISEVLITKALQSLDDQEYESIFRRQADKKWRSLQSEKNIFVRKNKWQQSLQLRGFESALIKTWSFPEENTKGSN
jgi:regulatory protein